MSFFPDAKNDSEPVHRIPRPSPYSSATTAFSEGARSFNIGSPGMKPTGPSKQPIAQGGKKPAPPVRGSPNPRASDLSSKQEAAASHDPNRPPSPRLRTGEYRTPVTAGGGLGSQLRRETPQDVRPKAPPKTSDLEASSSGAHDAFQVLEEEAILSESAGCPKELGKELDALGGRAINVDIDSGERAPVPDHEPVPRTQSDLRVSFGAVTFPAQDKQSPGALERLSSLASRMGLRSSPKPSGSAVVAGSTDTPELKSALKQPPRERAQAMYDEFDTSVSEEADVPHGAGAQGAAAASDGLTHRSPEADLSHSSDEIDFPEMAVRGTTSASSPTKAKKGSGATVSPVHAKGGDARYKRSVPSRDAGKLDAQRPTTTTESVTTGGAKSTAATCAPREPSLRDKGEGRDKAKAGSTEAMMPWPERPSQQKGASLGRSYSPPSGVMTSIGSEEPGKESLSSRFSPSTLTNTLREIAVFATSRRFFMLSIYCFMSLINGFQWIQYAIIANVVKDYYGVKDIGVAWTSLVFHIGCVALALPSSWLLDNKGLRITVLVAALGTFIGACVKVFSVQPDRFVLVLLGQAFPACSLAFIVGVPSRLASAWFKYEEVSTACSAGVLGNQIGIALGFIIPPYVVDSHNVQSTLSNLCIGVAIASFASFFIILVAFEDKPAQPPSFSEMLIQCAEDKPTFTEALGKLMGDRDFLLLLISYGLNTGAFYAISTMLNPVIVRYFPGEESFAGLLGLTLVFSGLLGSWIAGWLLDKTGKYKEVSVVTYALAAAGMFAYTFLLSLRSHALTFAVCFFLGFALAGYIPIGLQLGAEITYPLAEGTSSSVLNMAAESCGFMLILCSSSAQLEFGDQVSNFVLSCLLLAGCVCIWMIKATLKRQMATERERQKRSVSSSSVAPSEGSRTRRQSSRRERRNH
ncbi:hypothetical protein HPB48_005609 [Haemaphysalis longicornis]|uniref:Major facilitator superfamily (MFS) profile domain-containing protein n=1 Tax=Haemaphysalis longicornis TaxID=44386 RepID=A0A9J6GHK3_HAELO|nr:hypothetical protein HPB48_005609 [Haemaphysalis longicornis]